MSIFRTAPPVLLQICLAAGVALSPGALPASELPTGPLAGDMNLAPFYRWHDEMPALPGSLLRSETLPVQKQMPAAAQAVRLLYSSTDQRWNSGPIAVSGTLFVPAADSPPEGWPLLAWAHGTLGIADVCAPSWAGFKDRDAAYINRWLEHGFAVVVSDYQGLGGPGPHPYSVWQAEGTSVLDAIRAAQALRPGLLANRVILAGQSQGGGAALGAAILSAAYAPELDIRAAVVTAPNSTFPDGPVAVPVRDSTTMFLSFATGGLRADAPPLDDILSAKGRELLKVARQGCTGEIALKARELKVDSFMDLLAISRDALAALRVPTTDMPLAPVPVPLMIATGQADRTITPIRQYAVAAALCAAGNQVTWLSYAGLGHDGVLHGSLPDAFAFVQAHLDGQGAASNCSALQPPGQLGAKNRTAAFNDD